MIPSLQMTKSVLILTTFCLHVILNGSPVSSYDFKTSTKKTEPQFSRFKSLDRVINRLDGVPQTPKIPGDTTSGTTNYRNRLRDSSFVLPEARNVPNLDEDDMEDEDEDFSYEDDNETEVLNDHTDHWNYSYKNGFYRPNYGVPITTPLTTTTSTTTTTTTTTPPPAPPLSYSQMKWRDLGTRQAVEQTRMRHSYGQSQHHHQSRSQYTNNHQNNSPATHNTHHHTNNRLHAQPQTPDTSIREAINHALKVSREGSCKVPKPRLVRVQDFYPHPGKTYVPHCTILHQCSDDTGCCRHDVLTCSPKTTQRVELYFYSILAENNRASSVERLVFYNHTECECRDKMEDLMPRDVPVPSDGTSSSFSNVVNFPTIPKPVISNNGLSNNRLEKSNSIQCKCPSMYTERVLPDGACTCDCFDKQKECLLLKRGTNFFTMQDKWCIQSGRCEVPGCSYGSYIHLVGRCPRKKERSGQSLSWHRYLTQ